MLSQRRMGIYDRDYTRTTAAGRASSLTPVTKWLLIANVVIFILDSIFLRPVHGDEGPVGPLTYWGAFSVKSAFSEGRLWELVTFQFLHAGLLHIFANGFGLYVFGPWLERWWGAARFLVFYLLCGMAGAVFFTLLLLTGVLKGSAETGLVGASAGLFGILIGVAVVAPDLRAQLRFTRIQFSIRQMAVVSLVIAAVSVIFQLGGNEGGEAGHLGGAILGWVLVKWPFLLGRGTIPSSSKGPRQAERGGAKLRPRTTVDLESSNEIDRILDKISRDGFQSLTDDERDTLLKASKDSAR